MSSVSYFLCYFSPLLLPHAACKKPLRKVWRRGREKNLILYFMVSPTCKPAPGQMFRLVSHVQLSPFIFQRPQVWLVSTERLALQQRQNKYPRLAELFVERQLQVVGVAGGCRDGWMCRCQTGVAVLGRKLQDFYFIIFLNQPFCREM